MSAERRGALPIVPGARDVVLEATRVAIVSKLRVLRIAGPHRKPALLQ